MREIKFRGLTGTTEGKKWVYGYYYKVKSFFNNKEAHFIGVIRNSHLLDFNIDEDTLGQYTGLHDKNGKEIYEGDILKIIDTEYELTFIATVEFIESSFVLNMKKGEFIGQLLGANCWEEQEKEVIGNIYENSDLLED